MALEYVIYADESLQSGEYYSNFYGGALVRSTDLETVIRRLEAAKAAAGLEREVKWSRTSMQWLPRYTSFVDAVFDTTREGLLKLRVMFTSNADVPTGLTAHHRENRYHLLYYQFIKHAFGLQFAPPAGVRIHLDAMPTKREASAGFKRYLSELSHMPEFREAGVRFLEDQIAEVDSRDHVILQAVDVVLGAMQFRLNDKHKVKPPGQRVRASKTRAKEQLYKHINRRIRELYPGFNIGISTGGASGDDLPNRWHHAYRHWCFVPSSSVRDLSRAKK